MLYTAALAAHLLAVAIAFFCAGITHVCRFILARVTSPQEARLPGMAAGLAAMAFPALTLILLTSGTILTNARWSWTSGWIVSGILGLVLMNVVGFGILKPRGMHQKALLVADAPTGVLSDATRAALTDQIGATAETVNHAVSIAVVLIMILKPSLFVSLALLAVALALPLGRTAIARRAAGTSSIQSSRVYGASE